MPVQKITALRAKALHQNYLSRILIEEEEPTRAVIFAFEELSEAIAEFENKQKLSILEDADHGFVCYFGRYPEDEPNGLADRTTVVIQFLKKVDAEWEPIQNEIYNFGDLRPPKRIINEQVTIMP